MVGEESPSLQPRPRPYNRSLREHEQNPPRPGLTLPPLRVLKRRPATPGLLSQKKTIVKLLWSFISFSE